MELGVLGPLQVRQHGAPVAIPGAKPRAILTMLGLHSASVVSAETLVELLWGEDPPRTAAKALQTHISSLRRTLGDGFILTLGAGWTLAESEVDVSRYKAAARLGRDAAAAGDISQAVARFEEALALWRGIPELPDGRRGTSEKTRWIEGHAALVEDRADALLATGRAAEIIGELEAAVADAPLRERRWGQLMLALYRAGRQGEALGAYQRARALLADELGVDPGPDLRRLEAAIVAQDTSLEIPAAQQPPVMTRAVTFLLTDIEGSTAAWEAQADAMAVALARHDELVEQVVTSRGGRLIKTRGEGDATFSVFERPSAAASAAIELQEAIVQEPWALREPMRIRVALHTGEAELRDGDYFGRAVNRAARLRSLAVGGQILCSGATAELVIDSLADDVVLDDLGMRELRNLARPEHVFELRLETADNQRPAVPTDAPVERPSLPAVLAGPGPFVGRGRELERLFAAWQAALAGGTNAVLIAGEPGVGKTRLAGEWSRQAYDQGALVIYGRCDEDLGAPYQPFAEALRSLVPCLGSGGLRGLRGVEALLALVPGLSDVLPDLAMPARADPDTERYALFDAVVALLGIASAGAPIILILDDLHWAAKPTLLLLRHLLRFGENARLQIVGTYRSTDLDRSHPLAAMLADLHRDGSADRLQLSGLDEDDVSAYVAEAGYDDEDLARALASVTGGNPFFLIEALRHVDESGGRWDQSTLPQGVREAVSRRLSRLAPETDKALAAAAVVGSRFALELVERVVGDDLVDALDEACKAGIVIEEHGGRYRFNHAIVRQSLLAELPSVRRMRLHQRIATTLESEPGADDELLAELAHHYFECAWAGNAAKAVEYCRRAADQAMTRLAYEGAADLYDRALHALEEIDDELPDRDDQTAELLIARCEALLAAGDVASAAGAISQLQGATVDSARLAAWATCFDGQLSMLTHPERLDEVEAALGAAATKLAELDDAAGEATAHTVRAGCLARLGRIGDCEVALDDALTAARRAHEHRRVNAVLANAPLAALWGPNPVPRAGGRCLDVVRLLRITTDSPAVEATSTRCQAVLEAFRGRAAAARRMIDSARRTVSELGLRHALLEVEQFAGVVELVVDDPAAAEAHLRKAYNGFRRMGLDADTAETAALLGRTCLLLGRDAEADELCTESERLAGHALKPSIAWRTLRAHLLSRSGDRDAARRVAEAAVGLAERTDALVDHGDACLTLATVLAAAGDAVGARAAAERSVDLYERKGAAALAEMARRVLGEQAVPSIPTPPAPPTVEPANDCVRVLGQIEAAFHAQAWDAYEALYAPDVLVESRRKIVRFTQSDLPSGNWPREARRLTEMSGGVRQVVIAVRGERLALSRLEVGTEDLSPGAAQDEFLQLYGIDTQGRIALQVFFDIEDMDAAIAELEAAHARFTQLHPRAPLENAASRADYRFNTLFAERRWDDVGALLADDIRVEDRRRGLRREGNNRATELAELRAIADVGIKNMTSDVLAIRGERLALLRTLYTGRDQRPQAFHTELIRIAELGADGRITAYIAFDPDDFEAAIAELDASYLRGEAAAHALTWSVITGAYAALNRHEIAPATANFASIDHRRGTSFAPGDLIAYVRATWDLAKDGSTYIEAVHRLDDLGAVVTHVTRGNSHDGFDAEWREVFLLTVEGDLLSRCELFDEADIDTAIARFEQLNRHASKLENTASRVYERLHAYFAARDWDAITELLADDYYGDDRRSVVGSGIRRGPDAAIEDYRSAADIEVTEATSDAVATRGARLALTRARYSRSGQESEGFHVDFLQIVEIDTDERIASMVAFDLDDFDAAIAELDARYLAGEAAAHARTWSAITRDFAAFNRHQLPSTTPGWVNIDHRRGRAFVPGDLIPYIRATWEVAPQARIYVESVRRLSDLGAVVTQATHGTSPDGLDAEWLEVNLLTIEGDLISRCEVFDEEDIDAALAKFEQLSRPAPRLENAASQAVDRYMAHFAARDWDALTKILADEITVEDRRRAVNAGIQHGRDAEIANLRATADAGFVYMASAVIAARGKRLILTRASGGTESDDFVNELLGVVEINSDDQISAIVVFDLDDFDAAIAELDARYLAGEAAVHAHAWSMIAESYTSLGREEMPAISADAVFVDHRRAAAFGSTDLRTYVRAGWDLGQRIRPYIEAVHRLSDLGGVCSYAAHGVSDQGFDAEWQGVSLATVKGDVFDRCEFFDEADLDTALARFDQLSQPALRLENAASRVDERFQAYFAARDWAAMSEILADDISADDRRRVVNAGIRHGRDAKIADMRATADLGTTKGTSTVIAIRGQYLALVRIRLSGRDQRPDAFQTGMLGIVEINADNRMTARVLFDPDQIEAAIEELDARYLAGEAASHAHMWSMTIRAYMAINRHEIPPTTAKLVTVDHRRTAAFAPGDMVEYLRAGWDIGHDIVFYIEAVHRLSNLGVVVTHVGKGSSREGFDAEWREINLMTAEGGAFNRCEIFDEVDLDAALARFDELSRPAAPRLENTAIQVTERFLAYWTDREWDAMSKTLADNFGYDDRRRVVGAGVREGRDTYITDMREAADLWAANVPTIVATRGERLGLARLRFSGRDQGPEAFVTDVIGIAEVNTDERIVAVVSFDPDDFDAAIGELDARYLAAEAAPYAHTWSVITRAYAALSRHEFPATAPEWVEIDHRGETAFGPGDLIAYVRAGLDFPQDFNIYIEAVHRLTDLGVVITYVAHETSQAGFNAEWRGVTILTVEGDLINRSEVFNEADLDAAITRFDELNRPTPRLENAASQAYERFRRYFAARDWDAMAQLLTEDTAVDDHRRVVNAEIRRGRDVEIANMRAFADIGVTTSTSTVIATRGERLVLCRTCISSEDQQAGGFRIEMLIIVETSADKRILARVAYDPDDIDAAFEELDARYIAAEAASHAHTWSVIAGAFAAINRHELPELAPDWVDIDHRRGAAFASGEMIAYIRDLFDNEPDFNSYITVVHRQGELGAVVTMTSHGTSQQGFQAEWREIGIFTFDGDLLNRCELFDEADLDAALARFEELRQQASRLENVASRMLERYQVCFSAPDWAAMAELLADDIVVEDRRRVVNAGVRRGRDVHIADLRSAVEVGARTISLSTFAIRGERLALAHARAFNRDMPGEVGAEWLGVVEADADQRIVAIVTFDIDDIDSAFEELDARYLAGEAAPYASVWKRALDTLGEVNRHEPGPMIERLAFTDHRRVSFADGDFRRAIEELWPLVPDARYRATAVHALDAHGVVASLVIEGTDAQGNELQWARTLLLDPDEPRLEIYEESDLDRALARFEELRPEARRLENAASHVIEQFLARFADRDWDAMAELLAEDMSSDDRRRVVNAGIRRGRDAEIANWQATAEIWRAARSTVVAIRGERLALFRVGFASQDHPLEAFQAAALAIVEINEDNRGAANVVFDIDDIDAAFEELDARYLAGEAAAYSQTWSVIAQIHAALNRHELPAIDWLTVDHRRGTLLSSSNMTTAIRAFWDLTPAVNIQIEVVHRLNRFGAVATHTLRGTSPEGFEAEWRMIYVVIVEDEGIDRVEMFDEADLEAALARFEELQPPGSRLENAASAKHARLTACVATRDWNGLSEILADDIAIDDRRRVVNSGITYGRDAAVANMAGVIGVGLTNISSDVVAIRGDRLDLCRTCVSGQDRPGAFQVEFLSIVEIDADERIVARVLFDPDDIDAAFEELDARYLAGEAAAHAPIWSVIAAAYAALNRHELPATKSDWVTIDHRVRESFQGGDLTAYIRSAWEVAPDLKIYIETVHRLSNHGAVVTHAAYGTSPGGFDAEWRIIGLLAVGRNWVNRCELFDEADLDAALAHFEELQPPARRLENAASRADDRFFAYFWARNWAALEEILADETFIDDRRPVVNAGLWHGRDVVIANLRAVADAAAIITSVIATRGERLALSRMSSSNRDPRQGEFRVEMLNIVEIDTEGRIVAHVDYDVNDTDAAFAELDARYLAGEAAAHARTWSVIAGGHAGFNRQESAATTPDVVYIDRRPVVSLEGVELGAAQRAVWDLTPDATGYVEAVHRLSEFGTVITQAVTGTSQEGFAAEWRMIAVCMVEGDLLCRYEVFDEADLDAALARFDELHPQTPLLDNAATRARMRTADAINRRDAQGVLALNAVDARYEDRRKGLRDERAVGPEVVRAIFEAPRAWQLEVEPIAIRGARLALTRDKYCDTDDANRSTTAEHLMVTEVGTDGLLSNSVLFDPDDVDAAFAELDAQYLAGTAAAYARTWSAIMRACAALNRREIFATTADFVDIDHRPLAAIGSGDLKTYMRAALNDGAYNVYVEAVHRLSDLGAVVTLVSNGTSQEGFEGEWRMADIFTVEGDLINRCEIFDEADLDAALVHFDQLRPQTPRLENAASQAAERLWSCFAARDWAEMAETMADDIVTHDHRRVVNADVLRGRDDHVTNMQAVAEVGFEGITSTVVAARGQRLALIRIQSSVHGFEPGEMSTEMLSVVEVNGDNRLTASAIFDGDDIDAAFAELEARYLGREAAAHSHTWSLVMNGYAALNRRKLPAEPPNWVYIDHRRLVRIEADDLGPSLRAIRDLTPQARIYIQSVHRLSDVGAVVTHAAHGTSRDGFDAEWREVNFLAVDGDLINRCELFDETDLGAALARFDELERSAPTA
ncbi:BTAD domain-containing putative transcriptional regulator [Mycobacterium heidelbergense]|uniref:BTAD domain-containing putative transcriptional regulator n=1 Tax=Mycobacterium heidelbergense TaxID=53376 RepID=UPI003CF1B1CD